jgi:hypothetical protein
MARFFEQKLNFSLFYQNLIAKDFPKIPEETGAEGLKPL